MVLPPSHGRLTARTRRAKLFENARLVVDSLLVVLARDSAVYLRWVQKLPNQIMELQQQSRGTGLPGEVMLLFAHPNDPCFEHMAD